jgi:hypothetical protein
MKTLVNKNTEMKPITLYDLFECAVKTYPNNPAVCFKTGTCTTTASYAEVFGECEKVYRTLKEFGVKCSFIGVCMDQTICLPTVFLG